MSKYKPFSIENWNTLIRDINEILQNPPGGTDCQPIDPITEVSDPHIWAVEDVEEVRDKLIETCPDITFNEELKIWKQAVIDEIEEKMEEAWCDCVDEGPETIGPCGEYTHQYINASPYEDGRSDGAIIEGGGCFICSGLHCQEIQYGGPNYPCSYTNTNATLFDIICDTYDTAYYATYYYIRAVNRIQEHWKKIEMYQGYCDSAQEQLDSYIEQYEEDCVGNEPAPDCPTIKYYVCYYGDQARYWQDKVDQWKEKFDTEYQTMVAKRNEADSAAATNWSSAALLENRFPNDKNAIANCYIDGISDVAWGKWFRPERDDKIADPFYYQIGRRLDWEIRPLVQIWVDNSVHGQVSSCEVKVSPSGLPFIKGQYSRWYGTRGYTHPYLLRRVRWRCESLVGWQCEPEPGNCEFEEWPEYEEWYWGHSCYMPANCTGGCLSFCAWLWIPINKPDLSNKGIDMFTGEITRLAGRKGKDYSQEQQEHWDKFVNWYDEHPQYDDRHEQYC